METKNASHRAGSTHHIATGSRACAHEELWRWYGPHGSRDRQRDGYRAGLMNPGFRNLWPSIRAEIERHMPAATGWLVIEFIQGELAAEEARRKQLADGREKSAAQA